MCLNLMCIYALYKRQCYIRLHKSTQYGGHSCGFQNIRMIASAIRVANLGLYIFTSSIPMYTATLHLVTFFRGANTIKH